MLMILNERAPQPVPMSSTPRPLVIKTTSGTERPESTNQAFTVAAAAVAAGADVSLWLTGESPGSPCRAARATWCSSTPPRWRSCLEIVLDGGRVTVCTQCAARRGIGPEHVLPGVRIAGAAVFVEESLAERAQALVY